MSELTADQPSPRSSPSTPTRPGSSTPFARLLLRRATHPRRRLRPARDSTSSETVAALAAAGTGEVAPGRCSVRPSSSTTSRPPTTPTSTTSSRGSPRWRTRSPGCTASRHPELLEVQRAYDELRADLEPHLAKEERVLFPMIRELARRRSAVPEFHCGTLRNPISVMLREHDRAGELLAELRRPDPRLRSLPTTAVPATRRSTPAWRSSRPTPTSTSTRRTTCCSPRSIVARGADQR